MFGGKKRKDIYRPDRAEYLQVLVTEFYSAESHHAKQEIAANLANFAYNPINHQHLEHLHILDLFWNLIDHRDDMLCRAGVCGLVNLSSNIKFRTQIAPKINQIIGILVTRDIETIISTLSLLYFIRLEEVCFDRSSLSEKLKELQGREADKRIDNLISLLQHAFLLNL